MGSRNRQLRQLLGTLDPADLGHDPIAELRVFAGAQTVDEASARLRDEVTAAITRMLQLIDGCNAFDVIELMRMRELTLSPVLGLAPGFDGSAAAVELVGLLVLGRGRCTADPEARPHEVIDELHDEAKRLLRLATYRAKVCEGLRGSEPLMRLAAEYQSYLVGVRALQYESIQNAHERALFARPEIEPLLQRRLGFTYDEFITVRDAIQDRTSLVLNDIRDRTSRIAMEARANGRELTPEEAAEFQQSIIDLLFLPGERASFSAQDIADHGNLDRHLIDSVLDRVSLSLNLDTTTTSEQLVVDFLRGKNPFRQRPALRADDRHVLVGGPIGADAFLSIAEDALKGTSDWHRYDQTRRVVSESLATHALERGLGTAAYATNLEYLAPRPGEDAHALGPEAETPLEVGEPTEADALFLVADVAICVEVKARSVAAPARRGDETRLKREITAILGTGAGQARRLETLIRENGGLWAGDGTWTDLSHIREIRTVVATLDYLGPLGIALGDLAATELLGDGPMPWVASIHDLDTITQVIDRPSELLLYLRRRADSGVTAHYRGADELDLFMLFMSGGLFVEDDPDIVHARNPNTPPPTRTARQRHRESARRTYVGTHTDPLDAWMYWREGSSPHEVPKPTFNVDPDMAELVDFLAHGTKPGWLRIGTDLLALSGQAQRRILTAIHKIVDQTNRDGASHSLVQGFASSTGYMTIFANTVPDGGDSDFEARRLDAYMLLKKHQLKSDRGLGLLIDHLGEIVAIHYLNDLPANDPDLDALVVELGLRHPTASTRKGSSLSAKKRKRRARRGRR